MIKKFTGFLIASTVSMLLLLGSCAVIPTCPNSLLPVIEVQVNSTPSNHDDYINTVAYVPCRARIVNYQKAFGNTLNFPGGVEVEIRNRHLATELTVSPVNSGGSAAMFSTLPANGGWFNFYIHGNTLSTVDKAAILEVATAGATCNEVVLSRKALMIAAAGPIPGGRPQVEIRVGNTSTLDDYITWAPTGCDVKWLNPPSAAATLNITIRNMSPTDRLRFSTTSPAAGTTATNATINLTLSGSGAANSFYVAGHNGSPSIKDKDAIFEVIETPSTNLLSREGIMVRVRKNIINLTTDADGERNRYLEALRNVHQTYNLYMLFKDSHSQGMPAVTTMHLQAHGGPQFLPWHRAFILHLERLLQASDPSVALPYWNWDLPASQMFNTNCIGASGPAGNPTWVTLAASNPISTWQIPGEVIGIRRRIPYGDAGVVTIGGGVLSEVATLALGANYADFRTMEGVTHNNVHAHSASTGSGGWIFPQNLAPQDPLFYFLHCNVDRLWAKWQWLNNRYDPTLVSTYDRQGSFATPDAPGLRLGQYVEDSMWPWDNVTGGVGLAERPAIAPLTPFPIVLGAFFPGSKPTIATTIDFRLQNFCFDDFYPY